MHRLVRLLSCLAVVLTAIVALATAASGLKLSLGPPSSQSSAEGPVVTAEPKKRSQTGPVVLGVVALVLAAAAAVAAAPALNQFRRRTGERA